jgi:hypothetical protein
LEAGWALESSLVPTLCSFGHRHPSGEIGYRGREMRAGEGVEMVEIVLIVVMVVIVVIVAKEN